jgi:DNA polymerase-1
MSLPTVYLVDASIYIFRAWYTISDDFVNDKGEATNAVYGFSGFLCNLLEQTAAEHIGIAFDESLSRSGYRNEIYPEYKANRDPAPEELKRQFGWSRAIAEAMGLSCYADNRFEADDVIGTLATYWRDRGHPICLVTADKDLAQLVDDGDHWWDFARNQKLNGKQVTEKFSVRPDQIADYLALAGDAVDNIPGIPGIGPKSASVLLNHFETMDALYERVEEVQFLSIRGAKSMHRKLVENRPSAELSRRLTEIVTDVPSALARPDVARADVDSADLNRLFDELSFGAMLRNRCLRS